MPPGLLPWMATYMSPFSSDRQVARASHSVGDNESAEAGGKRKTTIIGVAFGRSAAFNATAKVRNRSGSNHEISYALFLSRFSF